MADSRQLQLVIQDLSEFTSSRSKGITVGVTEALFVVNPLDTGWSRSNWIPSVGQPARGPFGSYEQAKRGDVSTALGARDQGLRAVQAAPLDRKFFISNDVPYVPDLNDGSSPQAPSGYVQSTIDFVVRTLNV